MGGRPSPTWEACLPLPLALPAARRGTLGPTWGARRWSWKREEDEQRELPEERGDDKPEVDGAVRCVRGLEDDQAGDLASQDEQEEDESSQSRQEVRGEDQITEDARLEDEDEQEDGDHLGGDLEELEALGAVTRRSICVGSEGIEQPVTPLVRSYLGGSLRDRSKTIRSGKVRSGATPRPVVTAVQVGPRERSNAADEALRRSASKRFRSPPGVLGVAARPEANGGLLGVVGRLVADAREEVIQAVLARRA